MTKNNVMRSIARTNAFVAAAVLASSVVLPVLLLSGTTSAAQLNNRFIDMSSNASNGGDSTSGSGRDGADTAGQDVTYTVGFDIATTASVDAVVIDFCVDSPIIGDVCTAPTGFDVNEAGLVLANQRLNAGALTNAYSVDPATDANTLVLTSTTNAFTAGDSILIDLGTPGGAGDGITNPTLIGGNPYGTFYARIITYAAAATAQAYDSDTVNANNPGARTDEGGIALAVANELTVTARVQEVLEFCIGTETDSASAGFADAPADDCSDVAGTDLDLGVVDSSSVNSTEDDSNNGLAMIRTNALNGAAVFYKAEQETGSGKLKLNGATCSGVSLADACFNSTGLVQNTIIAGTEEFGMALRAQSEASGGATTDALVCDAAYRSDGTCSNTAPAGYAWDDTGSFDTIAASAGPIDDETVRIEFAATASPTTPTGLYTVTANFVATSTF